MTGKEQFEQLKKELPYISKDGKWYQLKFYDVENNCCHFRLVNSNNGIKEENVTTYENACELYNIELEEKTPTPDQYFLRKVDEPNNTNIKRTVSDDTLKRYLKEHKEECIEVIEKLKEIIQTHPDYKVRKKAYATCVEVGIDGCEELKKYTFKPNTKNDKNCAATLHHHKLYEPPVGEFGFCCEEEKMAILFSHIRNKNMGDYKVFQTQFRNRYSYEASILSPSEMKKLFAKYYEYAMNGKLAEIQSERRRRINSELPTEIVGILKAYGLRATRADGRGTSKKVTKCRRKKQYDQDRLSGYRIISIKKGIPIVGKKYELYEEDVRDFTNKLVNGEISLDKILEKERA